MAPIIDLRVMGGGDGLLMMDGKVIGDGIDSISPTTDGLTEGAIF